MVDLIAAGGAAGGAVFGGGAAGCIRSAVGECVMMPCLEEHGVAGLASDRVATVGAASGSTRKGDDEK